MFACGVHMRALYDVLPDAVRGAHTLLSTELVAAALSEIKAGDAVMIKGSLGTNMSPLVKAVHALGTNRA